MHILKKKIFSEKNFPNINKKLKKKLIKNNIKKLKT